MKTPNAYGPVKPAMKMATPQSRAVEKARMTSPQNVLFAYHAPPSPKEGAHAKMMRPRGGHGGHNPES